VTVPTSTNQVELLKAVPAVDQGIGQHDFAGPGVPTRPVGLADDLQHPTPFGQTNDLAGGT
jgi:hypothetical protein